MDLSTLHQFVSRLCAGKDPVSAAPLSADSIVHQPSIAEALRLLESRLSAVAKEPQQLPRQLELGPSAAAVADLAGQLTELGLKVTPTQLARVYRGSRSVIHPDLRLLAVFGKYRGLLTEKELVDHLNGILKGVAATKPSLETIEMPKAAAKAPNSSTKAVLLPSTPEVVASSAPQPSSLQAMQLEASEVPKPAEPWEQEPFFTEAAYDQVAETQLADWKCQIEALGLRRSTERLPSYLQGARVNYPRSFEPWCGEERAILMEALCYTNRVDRLVVVFGRSAVALEREGKKLIYKSRQKSA